MFYVSKNLINNIFIKKLKKTYLHLQLGHSPEFFVFLITEIQLKRAIIQTHIIIINTDDFFLSFLNLIENEWQTAKYLSKLKTCVK